jgi:hypothetical protein
MSGSNTKKASERSVMPINYKNKRTYRPYPVQAFMSGDELNVLEAKWKKFGFANRSDYIRFVLVHGVIDEVTVKFHIDASEAMSEMMAENKGVDVDE